MIYDNRNLKAFCEISQGIERQTPSSRLPMQAYTVDLIKAET